VGVNRRAGRGLGSGAPRQPTARAAQKSMTSASGSTNLLRLPLMWQMGCSKSSISSAGSKASSEFGAGAGGPPRESGPGPVTAVHLSRFRWRQGVA
jgi:hypothetical protein